MSYSYNNSSPEMGREADPVMGEILDRDRELDIAIEMLDASVEITVAGDNDYREETEAVQSAPETRTKVEQVSVEVAEAPADTQPKLQLVPEQKTEYQALASSDSTDLASIREEVSRLHEAA